MRLIVLTIPLLLLSLPSTANEPAPDRYRLEKTDDGYVRMDTNTGAMSLCVESQGALVCRLAADERGAMEQEIDSLETRLQAMQQRIDALQNLDERVTRLENSQGTHTANKLPSDEELDRTIGFMERFFRSFMGVVKDMETDKPAPVEPSNP